MAGESLKYDVIVLGAGVAGVSAALRLKKRGKNVAVIAKSTGASSVSSGSWDFGPIPKDGPFTLEALLQDERWLSAYKKILIDAPELGHFEDVASAATEFAEGVAEDLKLTFSFKKSLTLPTSAGGWKRTFGAQEIQAKADLSALKGKTIGLVICEHWRFRGDLILKKLNADAESLGSRLDVSPFWLDLPMKGTDWPLPHVATRIQHDEKFRSDFFAAVEQRHRGSSCDVLLFPPLFLSASVAEGLQKRLKVTVAECLSTTEPVAGHRLMTAMNNALKRAGIPLFVASEIRPTQSDGLVRSLQCLQKTDQGWKEFKAQSYVLATGKFFGGGVHLGYRRLAETVFDLPLFVTRSHGPFAHRSELSWTDHAFQDEQPWARLGVWVDAKWRPMDTAKASALKNLFACGSVIGGVDFAHENLGLGFMAYSGRQSGNVVS